MTIDTNSNKPINAPRCFGFASAFGADDAICRQCPAVKECEPVAKQNLIEISQLIGANNIHSMQFVTPVINKPALMARPDTGLKSEPSTDPTLDPKVSALLKRLPCRDNMIEQITRRINPFSVSDKPAFMRPFMQAILDERGDWATLIGVLTDRFQMPTPEAEKQYTIIKSALTYLGAVTEIEEKLIIKE